MQRLVAIRYSHARIDDCPLNLVKSAPGREERLLDEVLGVLRRAHDPVAVQLQIMPVGVGQLAEGIVAAGTRTGQYPLGHAPILASTLPVAATTTHDVAAARNSPLSFGRGGRLNNRHSN